MGSDKKESTDRFTDHGPGSTEWVYGRRSVWEALRAGKRSLHKLWIASGAGGGVVEEIVQLARERGVPVEWVPRDRLDRMVPAASGESRPGRGHHQGVVAQISAATFLELETFLARLAPNAEASVVGLDEIEDPQNVGAILRSAGFFGVTGVIMPRWRSAPVGEAAWRASAGAAEHVCLVRVRNLVDAIERLKEAGFEVVGADMAGEPLWQFAPGKRSALILGSEGKGLRRLVREHCDKLVGIPAGASVASLNVGSAAAIFLYEFYRSGRAA